MNGATVPMISAESVWKRYEGVDVLRGVDLRVDPGQVLCLIGPSGAGKSTFLRCINHLEPIDAGKLLVDNELIGYEERPDGTLRELKEREVCRRRASIGMVFQSFNLYRHLRVLDNVTLAPLKVLGIDKASARESALGLLERFGLVGKAACYPAELSGGEQQRVAIARALAMNPKLILFDEPTSALDPELVGDALDTIRNLAGEGISMVIVTHEIAFAHDVADVVGFMDGGVIAEFGPPSELFRQPKSPRLRNFLSRVTDRE